MVFSATTFLKLALFASMASVSLSIAAAQTPNVGVTAAVNVDARGRPPGLAARVLTLGNAVVYNEEVTTDSSGLVQILLLDGTTFTVGPNSQLTIDEFVYNPNTGEARVAASLTRGAFRFVGARTSQTEGGAIVRTPVATVGIRGAVSNIAYDPATREAFAALVAGNALTITDSDGTTRIVYEIGYTAVIQPDGAGGTTTTIRKSTAAEARAFLEQLAGKAGTSGGSSNQPGDADVAGSGVPQNNSGLPDIMFVPGAPNPVQSTSIDDVEDVAGIDEATHDNFITFSDPEDVYGLNLPFGGVATYTGVAQGTVTRDVYEVGLVTTNETGDFAMTFDFRERYGYLEINDFGDIDAWGYVYDDSGNATFSGGLNGFDYEQGEGGYLPNGQANGAFLNVGGNVAAGVIGTFSVGNEGVSAVGSFSGLGAPGGEIPTD